MTNFHSAQVGIRLAGSNKDNGLACNIGHAQRCANLQNACVSENGQNTAVSVSAKAYLVVNDIHLCQDHAVDTSCLGVTDAREVLQRSIELGKLVNSFIARDRLANEKDLVWLVDRDKLQKSFDQLKQSITQTSNQPTFASARIKGSLSCIRPAVSTSTTSNPFEAAVGKNQTG